MAAYPYDCIEQRLSVAVALGDKARWDAAASALAGYLDGDGLVRFFPADWIAGDDALTAYILRLSARSGWAIPESTKARMTAGLTRFITGQIERSHAAVLVIDKAGGGGIADLSGDGPPRRVAALAALVASGAASPALVQSISITPNTWPTSTVLDWREAVAGLPGLAGQPARLAQADAILRARLDVQGTVLRVNNADAPWQVLASRDTTMAGYVALAARAPGWAGDAPRLARALMLAQRRGRWDTTPANALGTLAMRDFARVFEGAAVTGITNVTVGPISRSVRWAATPAAVTLPWPDTSAPLRISHAGTGKPWAMVMARAAVPLTRPIASGFALSRQVSAVAQAVPGRWSRGDVMRVRLTLTARAPTDWVVINDPVPPGATILGGNLGGRSQLLAGDDSGAEPATFVECREDAVHAHYAAVGRRPVTYEYTVRLGTRGSFRLPPTRAEALYAADVMALLPNAPLVVQ